MTSQTRPFLLPALAAAVAVAAFAPAADAQATRKDHPRVGFSDTPRLPDGKWRVHDSERPLPKVITPGTNSTQDTVGTAPSDAVVLFDGKDLSQWQGGRGKPAPWKVVDGAMVIAPGSGAITTKEKFGDCQIHIEFASPVPARGHDQDRGNSGVIIMERYEIQVLDSYDNPTYADGGAAAIYGQYPPLVNASRKPGEWQTYDIIFTAPRFQDDGVHGTPAYSTVLHNGVLVHNHTAHVGAMAYRAVGRYSKHADKEPILLQDHGHPVRFRNIWVREIKPYDEP
jgi:Domain of Unknown Function (DUF1080)